MYGYGNQIGKVLSGSIGETIMSAYRDRVIADGGIVEGFDCAVDEINKLDGLGLLSDLSLLQIPSGYKANKLFSIIPSDGSGDLNWSRASDGRRFGPINLVEIMASNVPRLDFLNIPCPTVLVEPQRTNINTRSNDFTNAAWLGSSGLTVVADQTTSPDGTINSDKITPTTGLGDKQVYQQHSVTIGEDCSVSMFVKANGYDIFNIYFSATFGAFADNFVSFDLTNGTVSSNLGGIDVKIISYGNGWYKCSATDVVLVTGVSRVFYKCMNVSGNTSFSGDGASGQYWYEADFEKGLYPTTGINTVAASATRITDESTTGTLPLSTTNNGTFLMEFGFMKGADADEILIEVKDGVTSIFQIKAVNADGSQIQIFDSTNSLNMTGVLTVNAGMNSLAIGYTGTSDLVVHLNGVSQTVNQNFLSTFNLNALELTTATGAKYQGGMILTTETQLSNPTYVSLTTL